MLHAVSGAGSLHHTLRRVKEIALQESPSDEEITEGAESLASVMWVVESPTVMFDDAEKEVVYCRLDTTASEMPALNLDPECTASAVHSESQGARHGEAADATSRKPPLPPETLAQDLKKLLFEEIAPDFEVIIQDEVIRVHKFLLAARSQPKPLMDSTQVQAMASTFMKVI
eukprot:s6070_g1.t1